MGSVLIYTGSLIITVWGIGHLAASRSVIAAYDNVSSDNRRIVTMEWIAEGLTLCFVGVLAALVEFASVGSSSTASLVIWACSIMLVLMAVLSAMTGARTSIGPMRACPFVKSLVAVMWIVGNMVR